MTYPPRNKHNDRNKGRSEGPSVKVLFDLDKSNAELFDSLAEQQCKSLTRINSNQLRRFFGEIKDLYRRFNSLTTGTDGEDTERIYHQQIEPLFKMVRSKVSYATKTGGQSKLNNDFATMLSEGIGKVKSHEDFCRFVLHLEAVVGFMYGHGKVGR